MGPDAPTAPVPAADIRELTADTTPVLLQRRLGSLVRRFSHSDGADAVLADDAPGRLGIVTGFGPTNAPTAGTLTVMLGIVELQKTFDVPVTVVISELGAWNSRNVPWGTLTALRDQMFGFLKQIGFDTEQGVLRSHLDPGNLTRAGRLARFLVRQDFLDNREGLLELYNDHGLLGSEVGLIVDSLYTVADILGPVEARMQRVLVISGHEEAYFTQLARIVLVRQAAAGELSLGWQAAIGALYFRVLEGLGGYPKMSKSIPASSIHLGMTSDALASRILADDEASQPALLSAIELSSGWTDRAIAQARSAFVTRGAHPAAWKEVRAAYLDTFVGFARLWQECRIG